MPSAEQNRRLTQTGAGSPGGTLLWHCRQPAALPEELDRPRPLRPVRLLGQDLVLFRDAAGRLGLLDRDGPHRGADLAFGRLEDGGLRCPLHGWLFDAAGRCLDTPRNPGAAGRATASASAATPCRRAAARALVAAMVRAGGMRPN